MHGPWVCVAAPAEDMSAKVNLLNALKKYFKDLTEIGSSQMTLCHFVLPSMI